MIDRRIAATIAARPRLWIEALRAALATAPAGWWWRRPFLPVPDRGYLAWRIATAYGDASARMTPSDVVAYLEWRKRQRSGG